jgi:hypothetical protein
MDEAIGEILVRLFKLEDQIKERLTVLETAIRNGPSPAIPDPVQAERIRIALELEEVLRKADGLAKKVAKIAS